MDIQNQFSNKLEQFYEFINSNKNSNNYIISGHESPDADSICSMIALEYLLSRLGNKVLCINSDPTPHNLTLLDYRDIIRNINDIKKGDIFDNYSLIIVDTNDINNIGKISEEIYKNSKKTFFLDHHTLKSKKPENSYIDENKSSCCEIIFEIFQYYNIKIPREVGDALYSGILFDTGSFHYPKTTARTLFIASKIVENGTVPNDIYLLLFEQESIESLKIMSLVISNLKLFYNDQIAVITMNKDMLKNSGIKYEDTTYLINIPLRSFKVKTAIFFKENEKGTKKVSLRSKGDIDVASIAQKFMGGGHKNAAAFKLRPPYFEFEQITEVIINLLINEIDNCIF